MFALKKLIFLAVFAGPLMSAPYHRTLPAQTGYGYNVCGSYECSVACGFGSCCDYCAGGGGDLVFYCTVPCWFGVRRCSAT